MQYVELKFQVPVGYESQVKTLVMNKIEAILSHAILKPTITKEAELKTEVDKAYLENQIIMPK